MHRRTFPTTRSTHRSAAVAAVAVLTPAAFGVVASPASATTCHTTWGSATKVATPMAQEPIFGARAGGQPCLDRFVVDLRATPAPGWNVRCVTRVTGDGSGAVVPLRGGAFLQVAIKAPTYDAAGHSTIDTVELVGPAGIEPAT